MDKTLSIVAVISAGGVPSEDDPLFAYTQGQPKALLPIAGRPMIAHVADALAHTPGVEHIVVIALSEEEYTFSMPVEHVPDAGSLIANAEAGLRYAMEHYPDLDAVLLSSSDVPLITPEIITQFVQECLRTDHDLYYPIVERSVMEARFPESRRSYAHLKDGDFAGGDVFLVRPTLGASHTRLMDELAAARKNVLRQARMVGMWTFIKLLTRQLTIEEGTQRVSKVLGIRARIIPVPWAEIGMDVDKPFQFEIVRREIEARGG
ncbi:MAG TPA: hypothetical protein ENF52_05630 [Chloroflexi bacterium]|nr:hypothetical protein [Chloroflexota bacterium]